ncbi:PAS domain S-box-containing protein/diguanylate cyclase (GGDEF)-like protein [Motilibacter rhizosphaerae]|uniref:PAS domain S-box-containing protein/diguanylate cyclase (GGDEF)-like protein n=1 Tax=Motilibacter rhizosphaerae TaxID=598652 RepID=A0A4Q7NQF4_9ACTN|nr:GGDEF domain-containing phosphodiesterase [Motilibacter rhizosphaerae]RZS87236.1 PAS domain S-box-containing protein/diguanylate cyclase (GGDEF)-like protein [Motilibacter rhizosphaerae]
MRRLTARSFGGSALVGCVSMLLSLPDVEGGQGLATACISVVALLTGIAFFVLPFSRWPRAAVTPALPLFAGLVAWANAIAPNPFDSGFFLVALAVLVGMALPSGGSLLVAPLLCVAFYLPVAQWADAAQTTELRRAVPDVLVVCVLVGELVAYLVTKLTRAAAELHEHDERRFAALVENSPDITIIVGRDRRVQYASRALEELLGVPADTLPGVLFDELLDSRLHPADRAIPVGYLGPGEHDIRVREAGGGWRTIEYVISPGQDGSIVVSARDVTERRRLESEVRERALHDGLTGLPNRALLEERLAGLDAEGAAYALVYCGIDGFRTINDRLGRAGGDLVLRTVAGRLAAVAPGTGSPAHLEGDEFALLLPGVALEGAEQAASDLLAAVARPIELPGIGRTTLTASLGIAGTWSGGPDAERDVLGDADIAMYDAKSAGGGVARVYGPSLRQELMADLALREGVALALQEEQLRLHFQPIVDVATGVPHGMEALIRWQHPERGLVGPFAFLETAEAMGLMGAIDRWVLRTACCTMARLSRTVPELATAYVSANVSPARLEEDGFAGEVLAVLAESGLPPEQLVLEITESAALGVERVVEAVRQLRAMGIRFAVDDFGTGYSSLSYLQRLDFDILKVDKSFTDEVTEQQESAHLVEVIARLADSLGLHTVVEGVETEVQAAALRRLGVASAQGYLYARPVAPEELARVLPAIAAARV